MKLSGIYVREIAECTPSRPFPLALVSRLVLLFILPALRTMSVFKKFAFSWSTDAVSDKKSRRFSVFRHNPSRIVISAPLSAVVDFDSIGSDASLSESTPSTSTSSPEHRPDHITNPTLDISAEAERKRALEALEGRRSSVIVARRASRVPSSPISSFRTTPQSIVTSGNVSAAASETNDSGEELMYTPAMFPIKPALYSFSQSSPFAMVLASEGSEGAQIRGQGVYHVSVCVNVWMPNCWITTVRRGATENGPMVAHLEMGIMSTPATITMGNERHPVSQVMFKRNSMSSSRTYFLPDGSTIKWKLGIPAWQAHHGEALLASFSPTTPHHLILQPTGHQFFDDIVVGIVILMREHLTPQADTISTTTGLFNYTPLSFNKHHTES